MTQKNASHTVLFNLENTVWENPHPPTPSPSGKGGARTVRLERCLLRSDAVNRALFAIVG